MQEFGEHVPELDSRKFPKQMTHSSCSASSSAFLDALDALGALDVLGALGVLDALGALDPLDPLAAPRRREIKQR